MEMISWLSAMRNKENCLLDTANYNTHGVRDYQGSQDKGHKLVITDVK